MKNTIIKNAFFNALGTTLYIVAISSFVFYVPKALGLADKPDTILAPITMLSLLVFSAALTGSLMFGRPILWYLDGKKQEALSLLIYTLGIFLGITVLTFVGLFLLS